MTIADEASQARYNRLAVRRFKADAEDHRAAIAEVMADGDLIQRVGLGIVDRVVQWHEREIRHDLELAHEYDRLAAVAQARAFHAA